MYLKQVIIIIVCFNMNQLVLLFFGFRNKSKEGKYEQNEAGMDQFIIFCNDTDH